MVLHQFDPNKEKESFIELMFCDPVGCKKWFSLHGVCGETKPLSV